MAKSIKLITLLLIFPCSIFGQAYNPFIPDSSAKWVHIWFSGMTGSAEPISHSLGPDSSYMGNVYRSISYIGLIREDTAQQQVFLIPDGGTDEILLYDFSLETGDSVYLHHVPSPGNSLYEGWYVITGTDTIQTLVGPRKRIGIPLPIFGQEQHYWIEGVGSNYPTFYPSMPIAGFDFGTITSCVFHNGQQVYFNETPLIDSCHQFATALEKEIEQRDDLRVFPTFSGDFLNIIASNYMENIMVEFFDLKGQRLETAKIRKLDHGRPHQLNVTSLNTGQLYLLRFTTDDYVNTKRIFLE